MKSHKYDIFISYRRDDAQDIARMLKESLERQGYHVFLDMDELQDGVFDHHILDAIDQAPVYMIILSAHCLDRCTNEHDWVRLELEHAIRTHKHIIPINPNHQFVHFPSDIPLHLKQGLSPHQYSSIDTGQLYQPSVRQLIQCRVAPLFRKSRLFKGTCIALGILLIIGLLLGVYYYRHIYYPLQAYELGTHYAQIGTADYHRDSAFYFYNIAAEAGLPSAQRSLGQLYNFSRDIPCAEDWSYYWLRKAYMAGDTLAIAQLGYNYECGIGIPLDISQAVQLYKEGVELGDPYASYRLGKCLCTGRGLRKDVVEGARLISYAAQHGEPWALRDMQDLGTWIFTADSASSLLLRAVQRTDTALTLHMRWTNRQYIGGWMMINPHAYLQDVSTGNRFFLRSTSGIQLSPDTTHVEWGTSSDFSLSFPLLPDSVQSVDFIESDTSLWKISNIRVNF